MCAGPLLFCAFGPCHHQDVCSSCVARLRLLQKNTDCAICRKPCPVVFVTRYMDLHTKRVPESAWEDIRVCLHPLCLCHPASQPLPQNTTVRRYTVDACRRLRSAPGVRLWLQPSERAV